MAHGDESALALSDALHRAFAESHEARVCLLVDPSLRPLDVDDDGLGAALSATLIEPRTVLCPGSRIDPKLMPRLVAVDSARGADSAALFASIEEALLELDGTALARGSGRRICGWLQSDVPIDVLARHIGRQLIQHRTPGRPTLFRWIDPAVLWGFWPVLAASQQSALLGPIETYRLLDPAGRLVTLHGAGHAPGTPLELSAAQWADADSIGALNAALQRSDASRADSTSLAVARNDAIAAMRRARSRGFVHPRDLAAYAQHAMSVHPQFDAHPLVRHRLFAAGQGEHVGALLDDMSDDEWLRVRVELGPDARPSLPRSNR